MTRPSKVAAICVLVLLAFDAGALVLIARSRAVPSFARGGKFVRAGPPATTSTTGVGTTTTGLTTGSQPSTTLAGPGASSSGAPTTALARPTPPALGTYTYAVNGTESASIVGARSFPSQMTLVAHRGGDVGPDQLVLDQTFSAQHEEREIAAYQDDGVSLTDESGTISFGVVTQGSDVSYQPPMGQIPFPLVLGTSRSGTATARDRNGVVARVDDWSSRIIGEDAVTVAGTSARTWVVAFERKSRSGTNEQVTQTTRYWYDPARGISVRWQETVHGERDSVVVRGTYDEQHVATLQAFRPA